MDRWGGLEGGTHPAIRRGAWRACGQQAQVRLPCRRMLGMTQRQLHPAPRGGRGWMDGGRGGAVFVFSPVLSELHHRPSALTYMCACLPAGYLALLRQSVPFQPSPIGCHRDTVRPAGVMIRGPAVVAEMDALPSKSSSSDNREEIGHHGNQPASQPASQPART